MKHILRWLLPALFPFCALWLNAVQVRSGDLLVEAAPRDSLLAVEIASNLQPLIDHFQVQVGRFTNFPLRIVVAGDHNEYQNLVSQVGGVLEFSDAHYNRREQTVFLRHPGDLKQVSKLGTILLHEYIHAYVDHFWRDAPLWFHEGMAVYFSEGVGLERSANYALTAVLGNALTLDEMSAYPTSAAMWENYYTKSAIAIQYLYTQRRNDFYNLWDESTRCDGRFNNALAIATGMTLGSFSEELENKLRVRVRWEALLGASTIVWTLLPLVMLAGWVCKKIRNRRTVRGWETETPPPKDIE